jgi:rubrerythrin
MNKEKGSSSTNYPKVETSVLLSKCSVCGYVFNVAVWKCPICEGVVYPIPGYEGAI